MPSPKTRLRSRQGFCDGHILQLAHGHDWFGDAWGSICTIPADAMPGVLAEMADCWRQHSEEITAERKHTHGPDAVPWYLTFKPAPPAPATADN
jgi:hypothetical protein